MDDFNKPTKKDYNLSDNYQSPSRKIHYQMPRVAVDAYGPKSILSITTDRW